MLLIAYKNFYGNLYAKNTHDLKILKILNFFLIWKLRIKVYFINSLRSIIKRFVYHHNQINKHTISTSLSSNGTIIRKEILEKGYIFLENFLNKDFYHCLNKNFPKKYELLKSKSPLKNYNMGFLFLKNKNHLDLEMPNFINILYKFIISLEFEKEVNNIFNLKNKKLFCKNIVTSIAEEKSFLIPHMDSIANERTDLNINFIYFVDGNDQDIEYSGGTSIYADNAAENVLLKPSTLKNSLLIYDNTKNFFHGFKIMKKNNYRKAVTFQFNLTDI